MRYLQFLRSTLPDSTPGFDILLHRRTPLDQEINHLVIQCGEKHVHPISQVLIANLTGDRSPVYIPRFAFADMTKEQAGKLFETHDTYIKSLKGIPLFPMFANLDTIRTEYQDDGSTIERTLREWSKTVTLSDGKTYIPCDVVNGGFDQKAYLLVPPQYEQAAIEALETYRRKVFPFTQREARFRADIGPPSVIHVNSKLKANLSFLENLSALAEYNNTATQDKGSEIHSAASDKQYSVDSEVSMVSNESDDPKHDATANRPPTSLESIRNQYRNRSVDNATASTSSNSLSGKSRQSMLSTSSARFIELEARITRHQTEFDRKDKIVSDRLAQIERQLHRFDEVETKIDYLKSDIDSKLDASQQVQREDLKNMNGQILVVMENQAGFGASINILSDKISLLMGLMAESKINANDESLKIRRPSPNVSPAVRTSNLGFYDRETSSPPLALMPNTNEEEKMEDDNANRGDSSVSMKSSASKSSSSTDSGKFRSPDKKKQRPVNQAHGQRSNKDDSDEMISDDGDQPNPTKVIESLDDTSTNRSLEDITTDLESRYNTLNSLGGGSSL